MGVRLKKKINRIDNNQLTYEPEKIEMYRAFMTGYVKRINEASFNVPIAGIRIGTAKYSRLAQINLENRIITFSRYAIENVPERGRRYLVLHELAHVKETNHTKRFWQLVEKYEPNYRQIGKSLETAFKQNVKEEERKTRLSLSPAANLASLPIPKIYESNLVASSFNFENDISDILTEYQEKESLASPYDCELNNFLDWTVD